jgi:hypothetical protein
VRSLPVLSGLLCGAGLVVSVCVHAQSVAPVDTQSSDPISVRSPDPSSAPVELGHTVAVVANPDRQPLVARLRAELTDLGFHVEEAPADLSSDALDALTDGSHLLATVRIDDAGQAIEFRIRAPDTHELLRDRVPLRPKRADVSAVAAVELLRARLIKLGILRAPEPPPAPLPPPVVPAPRLSFSSVTADIDGGALYSVGGLGVSPTMVLGLRAHPKRWLAVGALAALQPQATKFSSSEGDIHSRSSLFGVITDFGFTTGRAHFELGGGIALSRLTLSGDAGSPYAGRVTHSYGAAPVLRTNLNVRLAGSLSLHAEVLGGVSSPRVAVRFADRTVAHWGRPLGLAVVGLEVGLW